MAEASGHADGDDVDGERSGIRHGGVKAPPAKVVIIDDNPTVLGLYTRLFQKAGYHPLAATTGREGLDLIRRERPTAAVIDYMLPDLSGIEICRRLGDADRPVTDTRLILFTSDDRPETRDEAMRAGTDQVVLKTAEAREAIDAVGRLLVPGGSGGAV